MRHNQVVVIGSGDSSQDNNEAYEIGNYIAKKGWVLVSGGRGGIMESASKGAYEADGTVIGIIPDSDLHNSNKYCNIVIPTGIGHARNMVNVLSGDVIIAIGGKWGTLSEIAYAQIFNRAVILCAFTKGWSDVLSSSPDLQNNKLIYIANTIDEVFECLDRILS